MKIVRIKEIQWWDPKAKTDALTYKVWVEHNAIQHVIYFNTQEELDQYKLTLVNETKQQKKTTGGTPNVRSKTPAGPSSH